MLISWLAHWCCWRIPSYTHDWLNTFKMICGNISTWDMVLDLLEEDNFVLSLSAGVVPSAPSFTGDAIFFGRFFCHRSSTEAETPMSFQGISLLGHNYSDLRGLSICLAVSIYLTCSRSFHVNWLDVKWHNNLCNYTH